MEEETPNQHFSSENHIFNVIIDEKNWDSAYSYALEESAKYSWTPEAHEECWLKLIKACDKTSDPNVSQLKCILSALDTMPYKSGDKFYCQLMDLVSLKLMTDDVSADSNFTKQIFELNRNKFGASFLKGKLFWKAQKKLLKVMIKGCSNEAIANALMDFHIDQFSSVYKGVVEDYENKTWIDNMIPENIVKDSDYKQKIQQAFYQHQSLIPIYEQFYLQDEDTYTAHHLEFETVMHKLVITDMLSINQIVTLCREQISKEFHSACFYQVLLSTLDQYNCKTEGQANLKKAELLSCIQKGLKRSKCGCKGQLVFFIELAFIIASKYFDKTEISELINLEISLRSLDSCKSEGEVNVWFSSRKAILTCAKNISLKDHTEVNGDDLDSLFASIIEPCSPNMYLNQTGTPSQAFDLMIQIKTFEIFNLYMSIKSTIMKLPWERMFENWKTLLSNCMNPVFLLGFIRVVSGNGSTSNIEEVCEMVLKRLSDLTEEDRSPLALKVYLESLYFWYNYSIVHKPALVQQEVLKTISRLSSSYQADFYKDFPPPSNFELLFGEKLFPHTAQFDSSSESSISSAPSSQSSQSSITRILHNVRMVDDPGTGIQSSSFETEYTSNESDMTNETQRMEDQSMEEQAVSESQEMKYPIFIHNVSYYANETTIYQSFCKLGIKLKNIVLKKEGFKSKGSGVIYAESKESYDAILDMGTISILNRPAYVTSYKNQDEIFSEKYRSRKVNNEPTLLALSDVPVEWQNLDLLRSSLAPYGHIKNISHSGSDPSTVNVIFVAASDCNNAFQQWKYGSLLKDTSIKMRKGYEKQYHNRKRKHNVPLKPKAGGSSIQLKGKTETEEKSKELKPPPEKKIRLKPSLLDFVPNKVQSQSKRVRLEIPATTDVGQILPPASLESQGPTIDVALMNPIATSSPRMGSLEMECEQDAETQQRPTNQGESKPLTNEDFSKFFKKD